MVCTLKVLLDHAKARGASLTGVRGVIDGDLPVGSGLSSSADEVTTATGAIWLSGFDAVALCESAGPAAPNRRPIDAGCSTDVGPSTWGNEIRISFGLRVLLR